MYRKCRPNNELQIGSCACQELLIAFGVLYMTDLKTGVAVRGAGQLVNRDTSSETSQG